MRDYYINYPIDMESFEEGDTYEGEYELKPETDTKLNARIIQEGERLSSGDYNITFHVESNKIGGEKYIKKKASSRLMPRMLSKPFEFSYHYVEKDGDFFNDRWMGQTDKGVKTFHEIDNVGGVGERTLGRPGVVSYRGDLLMSHDVNLAEDRSHRVVSVSQLDEQTGQLSKVKTFTDHPVDIRDPRGGRREQGSPDMAVYKDKLYLFFRSFNRLSGETHINCFKTSDPDYIDWELVSRTEVTGASLLYNQDGEFFNDFRLRVAANDETGSIMVVYFGVKDISGTSQAKDFRTFVSFDGGQTLTTREKDINPVEDHLFYTGAGAPLSRDTTSLFNLLIPNNKTSDASQSDYMSFKPIFDVYFDKTMGSYVILARGQPPYLFDGYDFYGDQYLIGLKTLEGSFSDWERCLKLPLDQGATGLTDVGDSYAKKVHVGNPRKYSYHIKDISVIGGECINDLFLGVKEYEAGNIQDETTSAGIAHSEFRFVGDGQLDRNMSDSYTAYGGKFHPRWTFCSTPINAQDCGIVSVGSRYKIDERDDFNGVERGLDSVAACKWKGQIFVTTDRGIASYALIQPYSNLGERYGYQYSYSRWNSFMTEQGWEVKGDGPTWTLSANNMNTVSVGPSDTLNYFQVQKGMDSPSSVAYNKPQYPCFGTMGELDPFKIKITVLFSRVDIPFRFLELSQMEEMPGTPNRIYHHILEIDPQGDIYIKDGNGGQEMLDLNVDFNREIDIILSNAPSPQFPGSRFVQVWWKYHEDREWQQANPLTNFEAGYIIGMTRPILKLGVASPVVTGEASVSFGDIFIGSYGENRYRNFFSRKFKGHDIRYEGVNRGFSGVNARLNTPIKTYSRNIETHDGDIIELSGSAERGEIPVYDYGPSVGSNMPPNLMTGIADYGLEFTPHISLQTYEATFKNKSKNNFNALSLINVAGVTGFNLRALTYHELTETWTEEGRTEYTLPFTVLDVDKVDGTLISFRGEKFAESQLDHYTLITYDVTAEEWEEQFKVVNNFDSVIEVDRQMVDLNGKELRLMENTTSFSVPQAIGRGGYKYFKIDFKTPVSPILSYVGEVCFGQLVSLSDKVVDDEHSSASSFGISESDLGHLYTTEVMEGNTYESLTLTLEGLTQYDGSSQKVLDLLTSLQTKNKSFPIIIKHNGAQLQTFYGVIDTEFTHEPSDYGKRSTSLPLLVQKYRPRALSRFQDRPPRFDISIDPVEQVIGNDQSFEAITSQSDIVNYTWSMGNGDTMQGQNFLYTYLEDGEYMVECVAKNDAGIETARRKKVYVVNLSADSYNLEITRVQEGGGNRVLDIKAVGKRDGVEVPLDGSLTYLIELEGAAGDSAGDVIFGNPQGPWGVTNFQGASEAQRTFVSGGGSFKFAVLLEGSSYTSLEISVEDSLGKKDTIVLDVT